MVVALEKLRCIFGGVISPSVGFLVAPPGPSVSLNRLMLMGISFRTFRHEPTLYRCVMRCGNTTHAESCGKNEFKCCINTR